MTEELDVHLEQLPESFVVKDFQGVSRKFYVERGILPNGIFLEALSDLKYQEVSPENNKLSESLQKLNDNIYCPYPTKG
ncbi:DUF7686 domain-containing protein [Neobacillus notoginsengisoli]|nr:hypothetical protein [Neobacillus notoginsengisoli]